MSFRRPRISALSLLGFLALGLFAAGCGGAQTAPDGRCMLLTTNDSEAHFDGDRVELTPLVYRGTVARIAAVRRRLAAERKGGVLLLSAGDVLQGRYMERSDRDRSRAAREAWQIYEAAGYDLGTLGNHEFDAGPAVLKHALLGLSRYRMVVSNLANDSPTLDNSDGRLWDEIAVRDCGGIKVGFFGLLTPSTRTISQFGDTRFRDERDPVVPAAKAAVARLKQAGARLIVGLTHLGVDEDVALAGKLEGVDVLIGGHSHTLLKRWRRVGNTLVVQTGARFSHLGFLELVMGADGRLSPGDSRWHVEAVDDAMPEDPATVAAVAKLRDGYAREVVVGNRTQPWALVGWQRHLYGQRVARALWRFSAAHNSKGVGIDGAIINSGGLRSAQIYPPGPVTNLEIRAIHPFGNRPVVVDLDGETLRDVFEHACAGGRGGKVGDRIEVWGIRFRCDIHRPAVRYRLQDGRVVGVQSRGQRAVDIIVGDEPLRGDKRYRVATNDYLARGGSGFAQFARGERACLDGAAFEPAHCQGQATVAELVEAGVKDGSFDVEVPDR
jgi:5'-nucleotidase